MSFHHFFKKLLLTGLLLLTGFFYSGCTKEQARPQAGPAQVGVVTVAAEPVVLTTELPGRTASFLVAEIRPQVNGLLQKRHFQEGSFVKVNDLLYQIDPAPYQTAYDQAKAALAMAEANVVTAEANVVLAEADLPAIRSRAERLKGLAAIHAVGQQDYDDASAALRQAEANLALRKTAVESSRKSVEVSRTAVESARINLSYTPIKAPISGRIGISNITVGAMVTAYQPTPLAVIQQLDPIYVDVTQASAEMLRLQRSMGNGNLKRSGASHKVKIRLEDGTMYPLEGTLQFRDVTVDPTTGSVTLRLIFPNPDYVLLPGMFVRATVEEGVNDQALLVPQQGVTRDVKGNPTAWIVNRENKVELRTLTLDRALGDKWLVTGGLAVGDRLIVEGTQKTRPGATVNPVPFVGGAKPAAGEGQPSGATK